MIDSTDQQKYHIIKEELVKLSKDLQQQRVRVWDIQGSDTNLPE